MVTDTVPDVSGCSFVTRPPTSAFAPEDFVGDDLLMIQTAEQFARKELIPAVERIDQQEEGLMPALFRQAGEIGLVGVDMPEAYGGLGLGKNLASRILEFLSMQASFSVTFGVSAGMGQFGIAAFGSEELKQRYLPKTTTGEWMAAYALSEPNSGTDALSASCRAELRGDKWVLNGTKMWISNAKWANLFTVFAKIDGEHFTAFLVERDMPGVSISREEHKLGLKGSSTARLVLENAEVPVGNLLHLPGKGHQVAFNCLNLGRLKLASMSIGPARHSIECAAGYAMERRQFGKAISEFGLIRQKLTQMAARFFASEAMIYRTGALMDGAFARNDGSVDGVIRAAGEFSVESSMCKVFATEAEAFIIDEALQIYGGYGFTEEFPIARHYRDARVSRIYEGTNEINRVFVADRLLKRVEGCDLHAEGFLGELLIKGIKHGASDQVAQGALADLAILTYAEQSARIRANKVGGHGHALHRAFLLWAIPEAAKAFQILTGDSITLPATDRLGVGDVAAAVLEKRGPL